MSMGGRDGDRVWCIVCNQFAIVCIARVPLNKD